MNIRLARYEDCRRIAEIHVESWQEAYRGIVADEFLAAMSVDEREVNWQQRLAGKPAPSTLVAELAGRVVGWVCYGACPDEDAVAGDGAVWALYICPNQQRGGIGRALLQAARTALQVPGARRFSLWVIVGNGRAVDFYRAMGLSVEPDSRRAFFELGGRMMEEVRMSAVVGQPAIATDKSAIAAIRDFWFADGDKPRRAWFAKDETFDADIGRRFGTLLATAQAGGLRDWPATPEGLSAYLLLLDQFSRNVFRNRPAAFAGDAMALYAAQTALAAGLDKHLPPLQRVFVYLPFEHAEDLAMQDRAVALFGELAAEQPALAGYLDYAHKHRQVIARFGRFPHRNAILGRVSSAEEIAYLAEPGSGF
ncbi:DUF924 family protein [Chitinimonas arctica]|nr:DUF924 family protein [Chitinimonas arctica]